MTKADIIKNLGLQPHPEGGYFRRTYCSETTLPSGRATASAIYFLLEAGVQSRWHTTDGDELWFWQAGSAVTLMTAPDKGTQPTIVTLGNNLKAGQVLQHCVQANHWQSARCAGNRADDWALVSCVVSPEFQFEGFVMAAEDWTPGSHNP